MTEEKSGFADRFARWARMGNNGRDAKTMENERLNGNRAVAEEEQRDGRPETQASGGGQIVEAETDRGANEGNDSAQLRSELEQARGERDQLKDRLARLQAEFDNARKREFKEKQDARDYATQAAVEPFLGVMDHFQLALKADASVEQLRAGVELILKQMEEALRGLNVQPVEAAGTQFDPRVHEALGSVETPEYPDHQVIEEIRRGYKLRDKLLRPALVKIATNSAQKEA